MSGTSQGGKKAAQTRGHKNLSEAGKKGGAVRSREGKARGSERSGRGRSQMSLSEAGRKGGKKTQNRSQSK